MNDISRVVNSIFQARKNKVYIKEIKLHSRCFWIVRNFQGNFLRFSNWHLMVWYMRKDEKYPRKNIQGVNSMKVCPFNKKFVSSKKIVCFIMSWLWKSWILAARILNYHERWEGERRNLFRKSRNLKTCFRKLVLSFPSICFRRRGRNTRNI